MILSCKSNEKLWWWKTYVSSKTLNVLFCIQINKRNTYMIQTNTKRTKPSFWIAAAIMCPGFTRWKGSAFSLCSIASLLHVLFYVNYIQKPICELISQGSFKTRYNNTYTKSIFHFKDECIILNRQMLYTLLLKFKSVFF